ncbi:hypothetical protein SCLCIDRAFT_137924, partial [Scleroderma citrinum Foug A]
LRHLAFKIIHLSTVLLPAWKKILEELGLVITLIPCDVVTRWNSLCNMLEYCAKHQEPIEKITAQHQDLRKFELAEDEWELVKQLCTVLKDTTLYFSRATPNLATMIPAMDHVHEQLSLFSCDQKYSPSIHMAVSLATKTLNRYYGLTDSSEVYHITVMTVPNPYLGLVNTLILVRPLPSS